MAGIGDARAAFLVGDLAVELGRHPVEIGHHHLDLRHPPTLLVDLEAAQPDQRVTRFHIEGPIPRHARKAGAVGAGDEREDVPDVTQAPPTIAANRW